MAQSLLVLVSQMMMNLGQLTLLGTGKIGREHLVEVVVANSVLVMLGMGIGTQIGREDLVEVVVATSALMQLGMGIGEVKLGVGIGNEDLVGLVPSAFLLLDTLLGTG